jgi:hypothetical protein
VTEEDGGQYQYMPARLLIFRSRVVFREAEGLKNKRHGKLSRREASQAAAVSRQIPKLRR